MSSTASVASEQLGAQQPRLSSIPAHRGSTGPEIIEAAELAGLYLDDWQRLVLVSSMGEREDGKWAAPTVVVVAPRQNGKNGILEARELGSLFVLDEVLTIHSAHQYDTSIEAFRRLRFLVENTPEYDRRVKRYINAHAAEGLELKPAPVVSVAAGGLLRRPAPRIRFRTRTKGGGRGFAAPCVIFDEAMIFPDASHAAILPIVSAQPDPQVWYTGSAVDQTTNDNGLVFARIRRRGLAGDARVAYFEWSVDRATPADAEPELLRDPAAWAQANPAMGIRINGEYLAGELGDLGPRAFAVERLGIGDWPDPDAAADAVIDPTVWASLADAHARLADPVVLAFDVTPDRSSSAVGAAGLSQLGRPMVEVAAAERGTAWVVPWLVARVPQHKPLAVVCDATGAAASLLLELQEAGIEVLPLSAKEHAAGAGAFYDAAIERRLTHLGQWSLDVAIRGATQRPLGGAWAWNRRTSAVDISPLVAVTLAFEGYRQKQYEKPKRRPSVINLNDV